MIFGEDEIIVSVSRTKNKISNPLITAALPENPVTKKGRDWLLGGFQFGTEIGGTSGKKITPYITEDITECVQMVIDIVMDTSGGYNR